ncbi:FAD-dependent monooxygenase [Aporhodopirellula aestuarii]|uniref:FAD-dependent monooxygenase n=1 Tax=Aporhodopirellula aestuarii TaxID=2950107 RepID=A0ABT0U9F4_9BACT|nr:FAD-dependent monooxygenase [Aporhodopirellula aestuarii]MCM2373401.1 FAD-dependent monooxygenase [Aporhodopirellula aestuarii]
MIAASHQQPSRVLVIGAGVAGNAAAIRFVHHGHDVTMVERATFPREKICGCCLGAAGLRALDAIGLGDAVRDLGTPTHTFVAYMQTGKVDSTSSSPLACASPIRLPIAHGVAVSRSVLDTFLVDQAIQAGVRVWQPCEAQVVSTDLDGVSVRYRNVPRDRESEPASDTARLSAGSSEQDAWRYTDEFDLVVVAAGLTGVYSGRNQRATKSHDAVGASTSRRWQLPWIESPHGPLGIAAHLAAADPLSQSWDLPRGEIQMVCGDEGYVGLVRLPNNDIDIAAALRSERQRRGGLVETLAIDEPQSCSTTNRLARLLQSHPQWTVTMNDRLVTWLHDRADLMTAPPLRRQRQPGEGRVVAIGDCAGYVEPMTGEGMTWGIESGLAVADLWQEQSSRADFAARWANKLQSLQPKRRILCGSVTRAMRSSVIRGAALSGLRFAPWLASPITRGLAAGPSFKPTRAFELAP